MEILNRVVSAKTFENRKKSVSYIAWEAFKRTAESTLTTTYTTKIRSRCLDRFLLQQKHPHCNKINFSYLLTCYTFGIHSYWKGPFYFTQNARIKKNTELYVFA